MGRYTKYHSNYVLRKEHQNVKNGKIYERDWTTVTSLNILRFGSGRKPWYNDGTFVFTTSNIPTYHKRHKLSSSVEEYTWDDCKNSDDTVNTVKPKYNSTDLRDYAYYGSCVELVRSTVEDIIKNFPGRIKNTGETLKVSYGKSNEGESESDGGYSYEITGYHILENQFNIDLHHQSITLDDGANSMRYFCKSYDSYVAEINKDNETRTYNICGFSVDTVDTSQCPKDFEYKQIATIKLTYCDEDGNTVTDNDFPTEVYGYQVNGGVTYMVKDDIDISFTIRPNDSVIEDYFSELDGFSSQLLRQDSKPYYKNVFLTPVSGTDLRWKYVNRFYTWPSNGYCINITSNAYSEFLSGLIEIATAFDDMWSDNIYRSMTHEAIKNYDWTYTRYYSENEANIEGTDRVKQILRVMGRVFDDVKFYIDSIKLSNVITYDSIGNKSDALVSDELGLSGFEVSSTMYEPNSDTRLTSDVVDGNGVNWYPTTQYEDVYADVADIEFMRRMYLSSKRVMQTKGTWNGIEMVLGMFGLGLGTDYSMSETLKYTTPKSYTEDSLEYGGSSGVYLGDWIETVNSGKESTILYDDDQYSGLPLKSVVLGSDGVYLVPYFSNGTIYDGNVYFQSKGGWGKVNDGDYNETLSYLKIVGTIGDMLALNSMSLEDDDIYYVSNIDDYTDYYEQFNSDGKSVSYVSHFFRLKNKTACDKFSSWVNIPCKYSDDSEMERLTEDEFNKSKVVDSDWDKYCEMFDKALYLDSILSTNVGNNPHVGYGKYDDGQEFYDYVEQPLKHIIDNNDSKEDTSKLENKFRFELTDEDGGENNRALKIKRLYRSEKEENGVKLYRNEGSNAEEQILEIDRWYVNTKHLNITFNAKTEDSDAMALYQKYVLKIIMPYLLQVIPSTTMLSVNFAESK